MILADLDHEPAATRDCVKRAFWAYVECALFASVHDDEPMDGIFDMGDLTDEALGLMLSEVYDFLCDCWQADVDLSPVEPEMFGHDFWLTRNGHGAGFWDRGLGDLGLQLSDMARAYGSSDLYVGDDGRVYVA